MGICPSCGTFIDPGEPYCPDCGYIPGGARDISEIDEDELIFVLEMHGYDLDDFERGLIDEDELEEIYEELECQ